MNTIMAGRASRRRCRSAERAPLPGEVVSRRRRTERKEPQEEPPLLLDPRAVLALKPERRLKWLTSALQRLQQGKVQSNNIYDILVHHKFPQDAPGRVGSKMYVAVCENMALFSQKQQRFLETESKLAQLYKDRGSGAGGDGSNGGEQQEDAAALVEKLLTLPPSEGEKFMATLDEASRDRLEELLEARILAKAAGAANPAGGATGTAAGAPAAGAGARARSSSCSSGSSSRDAGRQAKRKSRSRGRGRSASQSRRRWRSRSRGDSRNKRR